MTNTAFLTSLHNLAPKVDCSQCCKPLKCCDFQPFIPNFLLGGWVEQTLPELKNAHWHPIGLIPSKWYRRIHGSDLEDSSNVLACSFYKNQICSVYMYRPAECSIYYCDEVDRSKYSTLAFEVEIAMAQMALVEFGFTSQEVAGQIDLVNEGCEKDWELDDDLIEFYKKSFRWSKTITKKEIDKWLT